MLSPCDGKNLNGANGFSVVVRGGVRSTEEEDKWLNICLLHDHCCGWIDRKTYKGGK